LLLAGCGDDCVAVYQFDEQSGLFIASGCGHLSGVVDPTPATPGP